MSAYGGGTCNTEFEFLTGNSMSYLGSGVYPYTIYDLLDTKNLAEQFKDLGYTTTAMHPNHGTNWNRENVYSGFGFDRFMTINDFQDAEKLRGMVSDAATYDKILEMLESDSAPQFIFDVTMQNHSGYDTGLLPPDKLNNYLIDGAVSSLIEESDGLKILNRKLQYHINTTSSSATQGCVHQASPERRERDRPESRARDNANQVTRAEGQKASARSASA